MAIHDNSLSAPPRLGLVGYSTRALAEAAADLGFGVSAVDAFCDQDLADIAQCQRARHWPHGIIACARNVGCDGWLLAGGMENHGRIVAELAAQGRVLGPSRVQLASLRSVRFWRELAESVPGLRFPARFSAPVNQGSRVSLFKPRRSSGGMLVSPWRADVDTAPLPRGYWQEFIAGRVLGVTTLVTAESASFLGATESLSADQWPGPQPFIYRGSLGPVELAPHQRTVLEEMAARVGERLSYRGYLQADLIEDAVGQLWLLELNPRWTAGMEILHLCAAEHAQSPLAAHLRALGVPIAPVVPSRSKSPAMLAKAILYAPAELQLSREQQRMLQPLRQRQAYGQAGWWNIADVPAMGDASSLVIQTGQPILTLRVGLDTQCSQWAQTRQSLLAGLNGARTEVLQRVFELA